MLGLAYSTFCHIVFHDVLLFLNGAASGGVLGWNLLARGRAIVFVLLDRPSLVGSLHEAVVGGRSLGFGVLV